MASGHSRPIFCFLPENRERERRSSQPWNRRDGKRVAAAEQPEVQIHYPDPDPVPSNLGSLSLLSVRPSVSPASSFFLISILQAKHPLDPQGHGKVTVAAGKEGNPRLFLFVPARRSSPLFFSPSPFPVSSLFPPPPSSVPSPLCCSAASPVRKVPTASRSGQVSGQVSQVRPSQFRSRSSLLIPPSSSSSCPPSILPPPPIPASAVGPVCWFCLQLILFCISAAPFYTFFDKEDRTNTPEPGLDSTTNNGYKPTANGQRSPRVIPSDPPIIPIPSHPNPSCPYHPVISLPSPSLPFLNPPPPPPPHLRSALSV